MKKKKKSMSSSVASTRTAEGKDKSRQLRKVRRMFGERRRKPLNTKSNTPHSEGNDDSKKNKRRAAQSDGIGRTVQKSAKRSRSSPGSRVRVIVRCRPQIPEDLDHCLDEDEPEECVRADEENRVVAVSRACFDDRLFRFDRVLGPEATQEQAYSAIADRAVQEVMNGYHGTVLCYGQTGSGKTHTVFGGREFWQRAKNSKDRRFESWKEWRRAGILPRSFVRLFDRIAEKERSGTKISVRMSAMQLYKERLSDLLVEQDPAEGTARPAFVLSGAAAAASSGTKEKPLAIRESKEDGIYVEGLRWMSVSSVGDVVDLIARVYENRHTRNTMQNRTSSRSHCLIQIAVEQHEATLVRRGILLIVDLAGSERVSKSGSEGRRLQEAIDINRSISAPGNCVAALSAGPKRAHVPFRDSKLTRMLTNVLGGNSKSWICANVAPISGHCEETLSTLAFATRAMRVEVRAIANESARPRGAPTSADDSSDLKREIVRLRAEVAKLRGDVRDEEVSASDDDERRDRRSRSKLWDELIERNAKLEIENVRLAAALEEARSGDSGGTCESNVPSSAATVERLTAALNRERNVAKKLRRALEEVSSTIRSVPSSVGESGFC